MGENLKFVGRVAFLAFMVMVCMGCADVRADAEKLLRMGALAVQAAAEHQSEMVDYLQKTLPQLLHWFLRLGPE